MTVHNTAFVLLISLLTTSGLLLCATNQVRDEEELRRGVGIHLGITHSSVAVFKHQPPGTSFYDKWGRLSSELLNSDKFEVVLNEQGRRTTPSCVAFTDSGVLIGQPAKDQAPLNSERTICGITPLIGNRFDDPEVQSYIKNLPYKVVNKENKPHIQVKFNNGVTKVYSPEEICAMILGKLKDIAEAYMGNKIEYATVVVHYIVGSFEKERKERNLDPSIKEAGKIVGLSVVGITTSSRAASILAHQFSNPTNVLVYNLGGSAFDVSLQVRDTIYDFFDIVASRGDSQLGGQTFDMRVVEHFINLIKSKYQRDITNDIKALGKLRIECEKAKISLSSTDRVMIKIESLADGIMLFEEPLTRETFEELNMDLFNKTIDLVRSVVDQGGGIEKRNIDELVLVGGNARIPKIQQMLKEEFGVEPLKDVNPDEALAFVATRVVGAYSGKQFDIRHFGLLQLEPLSVGIETLGGIMTQYVPGGGNVRLTSRNVTTYRDGQTTIVINIFEGERPLTKHCHYLGWLHISDLPPLPRGTPIIKVTVEVDLRWDIVVTAEHEESQQIKSVTIQGAQRYKTEKKIDQARSEFWDYYTEDIMEKTEVEGAIRMLMPQAYSTKFAVVNADDIIIYK